MPLKDPEARKAYLREYALRNREAAYERVKKWRAENPGARTEEHRRYAEKYPEKARERSLNWKKVNIEVVRERDRKVAAKRRLDNPELVKAKKSEYAKRKKHVINAAVARRKAAKLQRTPAWLTEDDFWIIKEAYELAKVRTDMLGFQWHVDHIVPLQGKTVSGLHVPWNLQVIPAVENIRKGNRLEVLDAK
jgi:5-methylcytosine-specific restriction endonuclease McrA